MAMKCLAVLIAVLATISATPCLAAAVNSAKSLRAPRSLQAESAKGESGAVANVDGSTVRFTRQGSSRCEKCQTIWHGPGRLLFVGIFSAPSYFAWRQEVRHSWMLDQMINEAESPVHAKFVLGSLDGNPLRAQLLDEQKQYGDMIFLETKDYANLQKKTIAFFKWFLDNKDPTFFAMKLDDDTFPNFDLIVPALVRAKDNGPFTYFGAMQWHQPVHREGRLAEPQWYKPTKYPAYMLGNGYAVSNSLARKIVDAYEKEPRKLMLLKAEDTTIGNFVHDQNYKSYIVDYVAVEHAPSGCKDGAYFSMNLWPGELRCMWEKRVNGTALGKSYEKNQCCRPLEEYGIMYPGRDDLPQSLLSSKRKSFS